MTCGWCVLVFAVHQRGRRHGCGASQLGHDCCLLLHQLHHHWSVLPLCLLPGSCPKICLEISYFTDCVCTWCFLVCCGSAYLDVKKRERNNKKTNVEWIILWLLSLLFGERMYWLLIDCLSFHFVMWKNMWKLLRKFCSHCWQFVLNNNYGLCCNVWCFQSCSACSSRPGSKTCSNRVCVCVCVCV